jgi:membrane protease YdiL (CAAX protease family)
MAIVAAAGAATEFLAEAAVAIVCLALAVPLTVRLVRRGPLRQAERLPPGGSAWPLVLAMAWGLFVWIMVPAAYLAWRGEAQKGAGAAAARAVEATPKKLDLATMPPRDVAFLSAVPHLAAFLAVVTLDLAIFRGNLTGLGFSPRQAGAGIRGGALLAAVFVPLVFGAAVLVEWLYRAAGYQHPPEHDILHVLGRSAEWVVRVALIAGAVVVAPLSEELLFRGHAQTILRRAFSRLAPRRGAEAEAGAVPPAWATWGAIALASALFASLHAPWTYPPIFLLSVCLGWVYERTGNLWAPVAVHALFNGASTLIYLRFGGVS